MPSRKTLINYTSRDFDSIKSNLEEHAKLYYPENYKDFSENSFGSFVLDTVAYVGDMLSFYLDYQVNETFLETAIEYDNVRKLAANSGYNFNSRPPAYGMCAFYIRVPSNTSGLGPAGNYLPIINRGTEVSTDNGVSFVLTENIDFSNPDNDIVASEFSETTGKATEYAVRALGQVKSVSLFRREIEIGGFERFKKILVGPSYINQIKSVIDSEGHEYYQVDHLSQDIVYVNTTNPNAIADGVPEIIKAKVVPRRFVLEQNNEGTYIQFGYGSEEENTTSDILEPSQVSLQLEGKNYFTDQAFDPTKLLDTNTLGVAPSNTTLTVLYFANVDAAINVAEGELSNVSNLSMTFPPNATRTDYVDSIRGSIEIANTNTISADTSNPSAEELRYRTYASKAAQMRAVTKNDYEAFCYLMPNSFGSIKRACIINDPSSSNRRLSLYVVSENSDKHLLETNSTTKQNLKQWLNKNKMLNDNIDMYSAKIINIGFDYEIIVHPTRDKVEVLNSVNIKLQSEFSKKMYIGEPFYLTNVFNIINKVDGVVDTIKVKPILKSGNLYSSSIVGINDVKSKDGTFLKAPRNAIFEIKYLNNDIRGTAI